MLCPPRWRFSIGADMEEIGLRALGALLSQCGAVSVLLVVALVYQTLGRARDRAAYASDSKTWTTQAAQWAVASTHILNALAADKELTAARDAQIISGLERLERQDANGRGRR